MAENRRYSQAEPWKQSQDGVYLTQTHKDTHGLGQPLPNLNNCSGSQASSSLLTLPARSRHVAAGIPAANLTRRFFQRGKRDVCMWLNASLRAYVCVGVRERGKPYQFFTSELCNLFIAPGSFLSKSGVLADLLSNTEIQSRCFSGWGSEMGV